MKGAYLQKLEDFRASKATEEKRLEAEANKIKCTPEQEKSLLESLEQKQSIQPKSLFESLEQKLSTQQKALVDSALDAFKQHLDDKLLQPMQTIAKALAPDGPIAKKPNTLEILAKAAVWGGFDMGEEDEFNEGSFDGRNGSPEFTRSDSGMSPASSNKRQQEEGNVLPRKRQKLAGKGQDMDIGYGNSKSFNHKPRAEELELCQLPEWLKELMVDNAQNDLAHRRENIAANKAGSQACWFAGHMPLAAGEAVITHNDRTGESPCSSCQARMKAGEEVLCIYFKTARLIRVFGL